ncbi:McrB family protein [Ectobacillus sp. sgz5001026]|uniref:McrB family protein n=1 Tax=Ectobacillus sp. sgz5001026 TaxID=3242473 RepID=UPI0036D3B412
MNKYIGYIEGRGKCKVTKGGSFYVFATVISPVPPTKAADIEQKEVNIFANELYKHGFPKINLKIAGERTKNQTIDQGWDLLREKIISFEIEESTNNRTGSPVFIAKNVNIHRTKISRENNFLHIKVINSEVDFISLTKDSKVLELSAPQLFHSLFAWRGNIYWLPIDDIKILEDQEPQLVDSISAIEKIHNIKLITFGGTPEEPEEILVADHQYESIIKILKQQESTKAETSIKIEEHSEEIRFLDSLVQNNQLLYKPQTLLSLHTSLKTSMLTILSGPSGTGKSSLCRLYAKSLGLINEETYKEVPVQTNWTDSSDFLGYYDNQNGRYLPCASGIVQFLLRADKYRNQIHILVLDEMNLAKVEHYFAEFSSVLQRPLEERVIRLYTCSSEKMDPTFPAEIPLHDNLLIIGTVNTDDSTHVLSDKILDRGNYIEINELDIRSWHQAKLQEMEVDSSSISISNDWSETFKSWCKPLGSLNDHEIEFFDQLYNCLKRNRMEKIIGYRTLTEITSFLANMPTLYINDQLVLSRSEALDMQICQRILSKLRGSRRELEKILEQQNEENQSSLFNLFESFRENLFGKNLKSEEILKRKRDEVEVYGFVQ